MAGSHAPASFNREADIVAIVEMPARGVIVVMNETPWVVWKSYIMHDVEITSDFKNRQITANAYLEWSIKNEVL
jgi:hypothetical protein